MQCTCRCSRLRQRPARPAAGHALLGREPSAASRRRARPSPGSCPPSAWVLRAASVLRARSTWTFGYASREDPRHALHSNSKIAAANRGQTVCGAQRSASAASPRCSRALRAAWYCCPSQDPSFWLSAEATLARIARNVSVTYCLQGCGCRAGPWESLSASKPLQNRLAYLPRATPPVSPR